MESTYRCPPPLVERELPPQVLAATTIVGRLPLHAAPGGVLAAAAPTPRVLELVLSDARAGVVCLGLGRIVAMYHRSSTHFIPDSLTHPVPLFLKRQCDRTQGMPS
jgi:hypothetical protein